nr:immunoglobulin light chain junction region [Macaca mulatta]MOW40850.1 immunoglobulin light chain junction region [Macaca mulatta]MOW45029.1 immunoglobulin light chain junction region [Macaca mulatta]
CQQYDIFPYTF